MRRCRLIEKVIKGEDIADRSTSEVTDPYELWDWTAFKLTFPKPEKTLFPIRVRLAGLFRDGVEYDLPNVDLVEGSALVNYVYPFKDPKNMTGRALPQDCRASLNHKQDKN